MAEYIILNNFVPEQDEYGNVVIYNDIKQVKKIVKEGNFLQIAELIE